MLHTKYKYHSTMSIHYGHYDKITNSHHVISTNGPLPNPTPTVHVFNHTALQQQKRTVAVGQCCLTEIAELYSEIAEASKWFLSWASSRNVLPPEMSYLCFHTCKSCLMSCLFLLFCCCCVRNLVCFVWFMSESVGFLSYECIHEDFDNYATEIQIGTYLKTDRQTDRQTDRIR